MKNILSRKCFLLVLSPVLAFGSLLVDDTPRKPGEWGFRPVANSTIQVTPPGFSW
ncbi:MAG: hypothetical protein PF904_08590 [Kiritimatiellae bacterium]|nr:hypothetical protein [Kiritimatiellia bacterium]